LHRFLYGTQHYLYSYTYFPTSGRKKIKNNKNVNTERMLKQHVSMAIFKHTYRPLHTENKRGGHLQNCRLRLKKANKAARASKNRKRFRKSIIIRSAFSSWFHLHISMVPANNKTLPNVFQMWKHQL